MRKLLIRLGIILPPNPVNFKLELSYYDMFPRYGYSLGQKAYYGYIVPRGQRAVYEDKPIDHPDLKDIVETTIHADYLYFPKSQTNEPIRQKSNN